MKNTSNPKRASSLLFVALCSVLFVSSNATAKAYAEKKCAATYKLGKAKHKLKNYAGKNAIKNWNTQVSQGLGANWASWKRAKAKSIPCTFSKQTKQWGCRAIAKPCTLRNLNKIGALK